jgi:hypothetical protein
MTWLGGSELTAGIAMLAVTTLLAFVLRRRGRKAETPSALFLALVPVSVLLMFVIGFMLIVHGIGLV